MSYYRRLAYQLRQRRLPETEVVAILSEVRDLSTAAGTAPRDEFGSADDYAATFDPVTGRRPSRRWIHWAFWLVGSTFVILNIELRRQGGQMLLPWWAVLAGWLVTLFAGDAARFALDHRLPRAFTTGAVPDPGDSWTGRAPAQEAPQAPKAPEAAGPISYYRALAFHLRLRHLPEPEVERILQEVHELSSACGAAPEAEFGKAQDYAAQFERHKLRYGLSSVVFLTCLLSSFLLVVVNMLAELRGGDRLLSPGPTLLAHLVLLGGGAVFAVAYEHRLPRA